MLSALTSVITRASHRAVVVAAVHAPRPRGGAAVGLVETLLAILDANGIEAPAADACASSRSRVATQEAALTALGRVASKCDSAMAEPILARLHAYAGTREPPLVVAARAAMMRCLQARGDADGLESRRGGHSGARGCVAALVDSGTDEDNWDHEQPDGEGYHSQVTQQKVFHMCWSLSDGSSKFSD